MCTWLILAIGICFTGSLSSSFADPHFRFSTVGIAQHSGSVEWNSQSVMLAGTAISADSNADALILAETKVHSDFQAQSGIIIDSILGSSSRRGIIARAGSAPSSPFIAVVVDASGRCYWRYRNPGASLWKEIPLTYAGQVAGVGLKRATGVFQAIYRDSGSSLWTTAPTSLGLALPDQLSIGVFLTSEAPAHQVVRFQELSGFPPYPAEIVPCMSYRFDFNDARTPSELGFNPLRAITKNPSELFIRTSTSGGAIQSSLLGVPIQKIPLLQDTQQVTLRVRADRTVGRDIMAYAVVGKDWVELRDRARISGGALWSGGATKVGNDAVMHGSIEGNGTLSLLDRARVNGDVTVSGAVIRGNNTVITGTVKTNTPVPSPIIPETSWTLGSTDITVNPDQIRHVTPGNYRNFTAYSRSQIHFHPGTYRFASFWMDTDVKWHIHNTTLSGIEIFVQNTFRLGDRDVVIPYDTTGGPILRLYSNHAGDNRLGTDMKLYGDFILPKANLILPSRTTTLRGGLYSKTVWLDPDAVVQSTPHSQMTDTLRVTVSGPSGPSFQMEQCIVGGRPDLRDKLRLKIPGGNWQEKILSKASTPGTWQTWDMRFGPALQGRGMRWLHDHGTGSQIAFTAGGNLSQDSIAAVRIEYVTQPGRLKRQISLDDVSISCLNPGCMPLTFNHEPRDTAVWTGQNIRFTVSVDNAQVNYQWFRDGIALTNEIGPSLYLAGVDSSENGRRFRCLVKSKCDTIVSREALLTVRSCGTATIWQQPSSMTIREGVSAGFKVNAGGVGHFDYTWYRNGVPIEAATSDSITVPNVKLSDHGSQYRVKVADGCGQYVLSELAILSVLADSVCRAAQIRGPDTVRAGEIYGYEAISNCISGRHDWLLDGIPIRSVLGSVVLAVGPFEFDSSGNNQHRLVVRSSNRHGSDSTFKIVVVKPQRPWSQIVSITGILKDRDGNLQDGLFQFMAELWDREQGGRSVYKESFADALVPVIQGEYTLPLGSGLSDKTLDGVINQHKHLFVTLKAGRYGVVETIVDRLPLTAAPFALRKQP